MDRRQGGTRTRERVASDAIEMRDFEPAGIERIGVLRAGGLGDVMFALPALGALKDAYRDAEMTLISAPELAEFLSGRPGPSTRVVAAPAWPGVYEPPGFERDPDESYRFFESIRSVRFDLAVQLHGGGRNSNEFVRQLNARFTVGCRTPEAAPLDRWIPHVFLHSEALRWLEVVALAGARPAPPVLSLAVTDRDRRACDAVLPAAAADGPEVTLHPGAGSPRRRWPPARFAALGDSLAAVGVQIRLIGSSAERPIAAEVRRLMQAPAENLAGRLGLSGLAGLLARAGLHVGNDSGPLHLARALGTPVAGIVWGPNLLTAGPFHPSDTQRAILGWRMQCSDCGAHLFREGCGHSSSVVDDVAVDEVYATALELLAGAAADGAGANAPATPDPVNVSLEAG